MLTAIQIRILCAFSEEVTVDDGSREAVADPLEVLEWSYPNIRQMLAGKTVLDLGCAYGDQAVAMQRRYGCEVTGVDIDEGYLSEGIKRYGNEVELLNAVPSGRQWDVVVSINSMEHYSDPESVLRTMQAVVKPGGRILLTFGPPWWAPYGAHMFFFTQIPWLQLWFSEKAIMTVRSKFRDDGAKHFEECREGLNRMSLRKFERLLKKCRAKVVERRYIAVKRVQFLTKVPLLRELFTTHVVAELGV